MPNFTQWAGPVWSGVRAHWGVIAAVLVLLPLGYTIGQWRSSVRFQESALDDKPQQLSILTDRSTVKLSSTGKQPILAIVGLVLVSDSPAPVGKPQVFDSARALVEFRPAREALLLDPINNVLYEGKVSRNLSAGGGYTTFTSQLSEDQAAEVVIKDDFSISYNDTQKIPYDKLRQIKREPGKSYCFIESVTLTSIAYRKFRKSTSKSELSGMAFSANGNVFVSTEEFGYDAKLSVGAWDISLLSSTTGAQQLDPGHAERRRLVRKQVENRGLTHEETGRLLTLLRQQSKSAVKAVHNATIVLK